MTKPRPPQLQYCKHRVALGHFQDSPNTPNGDIQLFLLRFRFSIRDGARVLESSADGLVDDLGGIGTHEAAVVVVNQAQS